MGYLFGKRGYLQYLYSVIKKQTDYEHTYVIKAL